MIIVYGDLSDGQSATVIVTLDASDLVGGSYDAFLSVNTNVEDVNIPIQLTVNDALLGDINGDGLLNVQDIVVMVNDYILEGVYNSIGDINGDGNLNVLDVIALVSIIIN